MTGTPPPEDRFQWIPSQGSVIAPIPDRSHPKVTPMTDKAEIDGDLGPIISIEDPDDSRISDYWALKDGPIRRRKEYDRPVVVVEGRVAVRRLLSSNLSLCSLLVDDHQLELAADLVGGFRSRLAPVYVVDRELLSKIVGFPLHRGVVAVADRPEVIESKQLLQRSIRIPSQGGGPRVVAILEGLNDHENLGAIFRNCAAFGVAGVLLDPRCADPLYRRSIRVSVGHALHVPFARLAPWPNELEQVREAGFFVAALVPDGDAARSSGLPVISLKQLGSKISHPRNDGGSTSTISRIALVLGAEGPGLSFEVVNTADALVTIPMADGVDSLNVATAAAIAFHQICG
jgi:tRNA G18 (ribose-2'-O)-methylase SpoU